MTLRLYPGTTRRVVDTLFPTPHEYLTAPAQWVHDVLNEETWSKQDEVLRSLVTERFTAARSAHSTGKSHIASRAAAWWVDVHPPEDTFIVSTAPSANQVEGILWRYIGALHESTTSNLPGRITYGSVPSWKIGNRLVGWGRKPADLSNAEQAATVFQGIHAKYLLIIVDEACGIPDWLWTAIMTLVSDEAGHGRVLAIGNPDDPGAYFARMNRPGTKWNTIKIDAFCSPNFIGRDEYTGTAEMLERDIMVSDDLKGRLVGPTFVSDAASDWGEDSPLYVSKVLAEFPDVSDDTLIPVSWVLRSQGRDYSGRVLDDPGKFAVDCARTGKDKTVIGKWRGDEQGGQFRIEYKKAGIGDAMKIVSKLKQLIRRAGGGTPAIIDADGLGGPVYDRAVELEMPVTPFYAGRRASRPKKFVNKRSEQWYTLREWFRDDMVDLDASDDALASQLSSIHFSEDSSGRIAVETKKELRRRGMPSPDEADTLMMITAKHTNYADSADDDLLGGSSAGLTDDLLEGELW